MKRKKPVLRISPTAWAKLLYLRDLGDTEIGGFGISSVGDLFCLEDVELVAQSCSWSHVAFDDEAVADYFDRQVRAGRQPAEFARIWVHTHPGNSPDPSSTDEATFARVFGRADWAVMLIVARGGQVYARLRFNVGPGAELEVPVEVDYHHPFTASDHDAWEAEYQRCVRPEVVVPLDSRIRPSLEGLADPAWWRDAWDEYADFEHYKDQFDYAGDI